MLLYKHTRAAGGIIIICYEEKSGLKQRRRRTAKEKKAWRGPKTKVKGVERGAAAHVCVCTANRYEGGPECDEISSNKNN
jgi:hypothetical protein